MLKIVLYKFIVRLICYKYQFSYFEMIEPHAHARLSWVVVRKVSTKLLSGIYTLLQLHYTFRIRHSNNLIIYNWDFDNKKLDVSLAIAYT